MVRMLTCLSLILFNSVSMALEKPIARVADFSGSIYLKEAKSSQERILQSGDSALNLYPLDQLRTAPGAFLHLLIQNHGDLFVEENTEIILTEPQSKSKFQVLLEVFRGAINCFIEKNGSRFGVQTPVSVAGVLGTAFRVEVSSKDTQIMVVESKAGVEIQNRAQNLQTAYILRPAGVGGHHPLMLKLQEEPDSGTSEMMWAMSADLEEEIPIRAIARANNLKSKLEAQLEGMMDEEADMAMEQTSRKDEQKAMSASPKPAEDTSSFSSGLAEKPTKKRSKTVVVTDKKIHPSKSSGRKMDYKAEMIKHAIPRYGKTSTPQLELIEGKMPTFPIKNEFGKIKRIPFSEFKKWKTQGKSD
jgi:hypothetical protein